MIYLKLKLIPKSKNISRMYVLSFFSHFNKSQHRIVLKNPPSLDVEIALI